MKRKLEEEEFPEEEEEEEPEAKKARLEESKQNKKDKERKRKKELKRIKRERLLADKIKAGEEQRKADLLLEKDLELKTVLEPVSIKSKNTEEVTKKSKKNKKKNKAKDSESTLVESNKENTENTKTKKVKQNGTTNVILETNSSPEASVESAKKKKKKKSKESNSDTKADAADTPTVSQDTNASVVSEKKKKKKNKQNGDRTEVESKTDTAASVVSEKKKKSKENKHNGDSTESGNLFEMCTDWDTPLQPGEQEIVLPNKKYKGSSKLAPASATAPAPGFPDFESPKMSTPKSHTAVFLKKAMSKSATPKKKMSKLEGLKQKNSSSAPRLKKVNFALTKNMSQEISDLYSSIANSPGTPHDPRKNPEKSLLKCVPSSLNNSIDLNSSLLGNSKQLNPVQLNTQLNSISKKGVKLMGKKRLSAKDFF